MSSTTRFDWSHEPWSDAPVFERMPRRRQRRQMPARTRPGAARTNFQGSAARRAQRQVSLLCQGKNRRRDKRELNRPLLLA